MQYRKPSSKEIKLLKILIDRAEIKNTLDWEACILVSSMQGGMGSLKLFPKGIVENSRSFGKQVSEYEFIDADGVKVIASLNVDQYGELFELDIWKVNFRTWIDSPTDL